ncbi:MAG: hypothetical protein HYR72_15695 [Deltaproteobacteria bacterium]|nr:hypothetical protein [Deltaproteobacteria bacterium]MBI3387414.1 hypothetical protein [Deltaproteobacteria bacterium]
MIRIKPLRPETEGRTLMSEELLMIAVLEQALADLDNHCPAVRADAEAYFFNYSPESSAFSFEAVCSQFALSQSAIRREIRRKDRSPRRGLSALVNKAA